MSNTRSGCHRASDFGSTYEKTRFSGTRHNPTAQGNARVPHNSVTRTRKNLEGRHGKTTEKARALLEHACFIRMSCRGFYPNPGYQPAAHRFPIRSFEESNLGWDKGVAPTKERHDGRNTQCLIPRAQSFRRITESCPDPMTGRAIGEEDYSHGNKHHKLPT